MINLTDLDLTSDEGFEFEYVSEASGMPNGIFITVYSSNSDIVKSWVRKSINSIRQRQAMQAKKGKDSPIRTIEEEEQFSIENAAIRVKSWRGIAQPCNNENAVKLCTINPEIRAQIVKESDELGNFVKSKSKD